MSENDVGTFYPFKLAPVYKNYIWGGNSLKKYGKKIPDGVIVAESWDISCHPDGMNTISNGELEGIPFAQMISGAGRKLIGTSLPEKYMHRFPLLVKWIDANDRLSIQVHPDDDYAMKNENGEYGKSEMWYIVSAEPGATIIYDVRPGVTREGFLKAIEENGIEGCLQSMEVFPGDVIHIPPGVIHGLGKGIVLIEIQQNSNITYRLFDYNRVDRNGSKRPLHIEQAVDVINFDAKKGRGKTKEIRVQLGEASSKTHRLTDKYFSVEEYEVDGVVHENADGSRFYIYIFLDGEAEIVYSGRCEAIHRGESIFIPACLGGYSLKGNFKALRTFVPDMRSKETGCHIKQV